MKRCEHEEEDLGIHGYRSGPTYQHHHVYYCEICDMFRSVDVVRDQNGKFVEEAS